MGVVVVAAGMGVRLGAGMPKALVRVGGRTLVEHATHAGRVAAGGAAGSPRSIRRSGAGEELRGVPGRGKPRIETPCPIVVVAPATHLEQFQALLPDVTVIAGGAERTDSVAAGLAALPPEVDIVLVHDAARALAPPALFEAVAATVAAGADGVVPALPVSDTIKQVDERGCVVATPDRAGLRAVQTPQGFRRSALEAAHAAGGPATDDAMLIERAGGTVRVIDGDPLAMKITLPADIEAAERLLATAGRSSAALSSREERAAYRRVPGERSGAAGRVPGERSGAAGRVPGERSGAAGRVPGERSGGGVSRPGVSRPGVSRPGVSRPGSGPRADAPTLIILGGLPGVGKTTLSRALAQRMPLAHIRVDTIEGTLVHAGLADKITGPEGYAVAFRIAGDQLALGLSVVADTVNPMRETRDWWRAVASEHGARVVEVELECSDPGLHETRVAERVSDIPGLKVPAWQHVLDREYHPWSPDLRLDTAAHSPEQLADTVIDWMRSNR